MKQLLLFIVCCLYGISAAAQDIILKRNAEQIEAVVKEITDTDVKYRKFTHTEGVTYSIRRSEVFSITYENGTKDLFADEKPQAVAASYPYPPVSRSYSLGELFDEGGIRGIVIRVSEDGRHGLLLSLVEGKAAWGFINKNPLKEKGFASGCTDTEDGWKNMLAIRELIANTDLLWSNLPAFSWCKDLGPGWYLPAQKELESIWNFGRSNPAYSYKEHKEAIENLNLLLAEDNELNAEIAETLLSDEGAKITVVKNGLQAVKTFQENPCNYFDAILMDIMMPVMDGLTAAKTIRAAVRADAKTIPIIAMTANAFQEDQEQCYKAGMNAHLAKPLNMEKVIRTIYEQCRYK